MRLLLLIFTGLLTACTGEKKEQEKATITKSDTGVHTSTPRAKSGVEGVYSVPEMLCLSIKDTANARTISEKMNTDFNTLHEEIVSMRIKNPGSQGMMILTNTPDQFIFRCMVPINGIPARIPNKASLFVLEGTRAVVYNYYGPYNQMSDAYNTIKKYLEENKLTQTGPPREFYITDPLLEKDSSKWLSKIYVPVK